MKRLLALLLSLLFITACSENQDVLILVNHTGFVLTDLYMSPSSQDYFDQPNLLGLSSLNDGEAYTIDRNDLKEEETYDFLFLDKEGDQYMVFNIKPFSSDDSKVEIFITLEHLQNRL